MSIEKQMRERVTVTPIHKEYGIISNCKDHGARCTLLKAGQCN
jgi:hypothetical protein